MGSAIGGAAKQPNPITKPPFDFADDRLLYTKNFLENLAFGELSGFVVYVYFASTTGSSTKLAWSAEW